MQVDKDIERRNQSEQQNQSANTAQDHHVRTNGEGKALNVNENDLRDQPQGNTKSKDAPLMKKTAKVGGKALNVNENDVRNQTQPDDGA